MHCPRCGEQQNSGNLRFCPRCGLPMGLVREVVANEGMLPQLAELQKERKWFTRANGLKFAAVWFFLWFILTMLVAIAGGDEGVAIVFIIGFFGAMFISLLSLLFLKSPSKVAPGDFAFQPGAESLNLRSAAQQNALPPQQTIAAEDYAAPARGNWKAPDTGDLAEPGSVTEGTTRLLKKEEKVEE